MKYKAYPKQAIIAAMKRRENLTGEVTFVPQKGPSIFDFSKWPQWWEQGATELEKTSPGKIITAPIRLPEAILTSTEKTVREVPGAVKRIVNTLPIVALAAALLGGGYLVYKFKKDKKEKNSIGYY